MSLHLLLLRRSSATLTTTNHPLLRALHHLIPSPLYHTPNPNPPISTTPLLPSSRTFSFSSAEEAAAERRRRRRRLRIEPPLQAMQRNPNPPPRDPNAPRLPDSTSALTGNRLNLHNRVQSLIRASDLDTASHVARNSVYSRTRPTVFTCNAIIAAMYRAKRYDDAIALFKFFFEQHNIVPNVVSYNNLINAHCDEGRVDVGLEVYRRMIEIAPFSPSSVTYRHLTKGLIDAERMEDAVALLREMLVKGHGADSLVYNNVIKGFLELGNLEKANEFFNELKERCLVYDGVINATYMDWWFKQGKDKEAMESYKSWQERNFKVVPATCNTILEVLVKYGKKEASWALFEHMLDNHTPPTHQGVNSDTFNTMVNECFKEGEFEEAINIFKKAGTKPGSKPFQMDVAGYNNIIARFCENGMMKQAEEFFAALSAKCLTPDVTTFRTLIDTYLKTEEIDDVLRIFNKMADAGLRVVASFGTRVFGELIKNGKAVESAEILTKMGNKDPKPDSSIYDVVVRGLCNAGALDTGKDMLDQMMKYGVAVPPVLKGILYLRFLKMLGGALNLRFQDHSPSESIQCQDKPHLGSPQMTGQLPLGYHNRQQPSGLHNTDQQQPSKPYQGHQSSRSSQADGQHPLWSSQTAEQQSSCSQAGGQHPPCYSQTAGQQLSWSSQTGQQTGPQQSRSSQAGGQQPSWSSQAGGQQPSWSSQAGGQQPSWSSQAGGQQPSWSSQAGGQQQSWSSDRGGYQQSWSSDRGGYQPSWSSETGGQQASGSSNMEQQPPVTSHMIKCHPNESPQMSGQAPFQSSQNGGQYSYGSPSVVRNHPVGSSPNGGQYSTGPPSVVRHHAVGSSQMDGRQQRARQPVAAKWTSRYG
ncbi:PENTATRICOPEPTIDE (PPR) REPEAT-CONTAINING PROTEIN PF01535'-RELATED [Salix viminalis]|uniref:PENTATRICOPEPTIDE (PPR) REPEAT-CONTAINING PROTEIN PF01535'-RELATED n=1 Tax=Salix viminalis TaxID=40686 RepID=A0A9Q0YZ73_SALVM|nr:PENTATRICOPEPTIDE (PPR) REPEAT-CONTAINING PROTEIN PF01535'-RELATED [Salix viminalis]